MTRRVAEERTVAGLAVTEWTGSGQTVVALAGLDSSGRVFAHLAGGLPGAYVVAPHVRGRGGSRAAGGPTGLRAHARDVAAALAELDLTDVVLVGHSMGAYLATVVAQEADGRVARLVLVDGGLPPALPFFMGPRLTRLSFGRNLRRLDRDWPDVEAFAGRRLAPLVRDRPELRQVLLDLLAEDLAGPPGALRPQLDTEHAVADAVDTFFGPDAPAALEALAVPAHLVAATAGTTDKAKPFLSDAVVERWTARLPLLTAERVRANHVTVLLSAQVAQAVRG